MFAIESVMLLVITGLSEDEGNYYLKLVSLIPKSCLLELV